MTGIRDTQADSKELPHEVQMLINSYADIFATKVCFPPPRSCSHTIPPPRSCSHTTGAQSYF
jgi:hypothetical protein